MKGIVIYNGYLGKNNKLYDMVEDVVAQGKALGMEMVPVANRDCFIRWSLFGEKVDLPKECVGGQFILFLDKDILLARALQRAGYPVFNSPKAIALCDDKLLMYEKLAGKVSMPLTIPAPFSFGGRTLEKEDAQKIIEILGEEIIVKEAKGSFGEQVYKVRGAAELQEFFTKLKNQSFLCQSFLASSRGRDLRVNIVGDEIFGAMIRKNELDFRSNVTLGGSTEEVWPSSEEGALALKVHRLLGLDFSGVDILFGEEGPVFCEINSNVNYLSFEKCTGKNMGKRILEYIGEKLK